MKEASVLLSDWEETWLDKGRRRAEWASLPARCGQSRPRAASRCLLSHSQVAPYRQCLRVKVPGGSSRRVFVKVTLMDVFLSDYKINTIDYGKVGISLQKSINKKQTLLNPPYF